MLHKDFNAQVKEVGTRDGRTTALIEGSSGEQDRDGEFLAPDGCQYIPGSQFLYGHNWGELRANLGAILSAEQSGNAVHFRVILDDNIPEHTEAIIAGKKMKNGSLGSFSVGFEPLVVKQPDGQIISVSRGDWMYPERGRTYMKWACLELSAVPVPSNPATGLIDVRALSGPEGKALEAAIRKALDAILGSDEFLDRMKRVLTSTKAGEPGPAQAGTSAAATAPGSHAPAGPSGEADPPTSELDLDSLFADPVKLAMTTDNPEEVARALAAASGNDALGDLESFFTEAAPAGAGVTGT